MPCRWPSIRPGSTRRPCRSMTFVCCVASARIGPSSPVAMMSPSRIAIAWTVGVRPRRPSRSCRCRGSLWSRAWPGLVVLADSVDQGVGDHPGRRHRRHGCARECRPAPQPPTGYPLLNFPSRMRLLSPGPSWTRPPSANVCNAILQSFGKPLRPNLHPPGSGCQGGRRRRAGTRGIPRLRGDARLPDLQPRRPRRARVSSSGPTPNRVTTCAPEPAS